MAVDNKDLGSKRKKALNLGTITSQLEKPDKPAIIDKSDIVTNKRAPVRQGKGLRPRAKSSDHDIPSAVIRNAVQTAFNNAEQQASLKSQTSSVNDRKKAVLENVTPNILKHVVAENVYTRRLKGRVLSGKKAVTQAASKTKYTAADTPRLIRELIDQQTHEFISNKARELARNQVVDSHQAESTTILSQILSISRQNNAFFEGSLSQYLITSTELKLKHILVTKDILKYTKQITDTIAPKIDAVKHNTSLPDDNKSTLFEDIRKSIRSSAVKLIGQAIVAPLKKPLTDLIQTAVDKVRDKIGEKIGTGAGSVEFGSLVKPENKILAKTNEMIGKARGSAGKAFFTKDMTEVSGDATFIGKIINDAAKKRMGSFADLDKASEEKATFDNPTRRSITEIIPGFLAKIHSESTAIAEMVRFSVSQRLTPTQKKAFDKVSTRSELAFDKKIGSFVKADQLGKDKVTDVFGTKESNTKAVEGVIRNIRTGFLKHGGDEDAFDQALPDIVRFVNNIGKHAKVVKLDHIKKYLNGETLSDFEEAYMEAILADIPESSHKRIVELLGTAFFKDGEVDVEASSEIGAGLRNLTALHDEDMKRMNRAANMGDARYMSQVVDQKTGRLDHDAIRNIKNDVDIESLKTNIRTEAAPDRIEEIREQVDTMMKSSFQKFMEQIKEAMPPEALRDFNLTEIKERFSKATASAVTRDTGIPNRDESQVSGPGIYVQGAQRELHVPLDDLKGNIKSKISDIISNVEDSLKSYKKPTGRPATEAYTSRVDFKGEEPRPYGQPEKDTTTQILEQVAGIREEAKSHFTRYTDVEAQKTEVLMGILDNVATGGGSEGETTTPGSKKSRIGAILGGTARAGAFLGKKYIQGWVGLTKGLIGLTGKLARGAASKTGAVLDILKGGGKLTAKVLGGLLGLNMKAAGLLLRGTFGLGKMLFSAGKKLFSKNKFVDVYRKDEVSVGNPLIKSVDIKTNRYRFANGKVLPNSYSITEPVYDMNTEQLVVTQEDIEHGLVDVDNKSVKSAGSVIGSLIGKTARGAKWLVGAQLKLTGKALKLGFDGITALLSKLPGVGGVLGKFKRKGKGGTIGQIDGQTLEEKVTKHLLEIIKLIKPISDNFKGLREGSYDDYKRDRLSELASQRKRNKGVIKTPGKESTAAAAKGAGGGIAAALGLDGLADTVGEGLDTAGDLMDFFKKKKKLPKVPGGAIRQGASKIAQGATNMVRQGAMRQVAATLGRQAVMQGARSAAVYAGTALAGAVSAPVVATGLAIAGLGAGAYGVYKWYKGSERRQSITAVRNEIYRIPEAKMDELIDFEDSIFEALEDDDTGTMTKEIADYIRRFGLSPSDNDQYDFFKHWYSNLFFPVFKASCDIFKDMGIPFDEQTDLTDEQLSEYKSSLEGTDLWQELLDKRVELSPEGFKLWKGSGKKTIERDDEGRDTLTGKSDAASKYLGSKAGKLGMAYMSTYDAVRNQVEEQKARDEMVGGNYGEDDPTTGLSSMWQGIKSGAASAASSVAAGASWVGDKASSAASAVGDVASAAGSKIKAGMQAVGESFAAGEELGSTVAKYESGNKGVGAVSSGSGDAGGASYGKYQLASKTGTLAKYLTQSGYAKDFQGMAPGSPEFNARWKELAAKDPEFGATQHQFIKKTHFDPAMQKAKELGFNIDDKAVQEMVWSGSIQHGGIKKLLAQTAVVPGFANMSPQEQVQAFYKSRRAYALNAMKSNSSAAVIAGVQNRYDREEREVMGLAGKSVSQEVAAKAAAKAAEGTGAPAPPPMLAASTANIPTATEGSSAPEAIQAIQEKATATPPALAAMPKAFTQPSPATPSVPSFSTDALIGNYAASNQIRPAPVPAAVNTTKTAEAAVIASAPPPLSTPSAASATPVQQSIQVVDPEGKTQTNLLAQQNQLLSQMVSILSGKPTVTGTPAEGDNTAMLAKLDGVIAAIQSTGTLAATSTGNIGTLAANAGKRNIDTPVNKGINVAREVVS